MMSPEYPEPAKGLSLSRFTTQDDLTMTNTLGDYVYGNVGPWTIYDL